MNRLRHQGLATYRWEISPTGPLRKCYQLTNAGFEELEHRHATWKELRKSLQQLLDTASSNISGPNSRGVVPRKRTE
ncbi:helix-turn-helix transcriptional regulator [Arthrobacter sp. StoSoilB22]|uniref:PadR family transcriptional regulator n=1 Tax=Arthrobacter sp. StoSoilB22 TaxID=2830996 RepID=UPI00336A27B0